MKLKSYKIKKDGFVALTAILLVNAILLFVVSSLALQVIDDAQVSSANEQSKIAKYLANTCIEHALMELVNDPTTTVSDDTVSGIDLTFQTDEECNYSISGNYPTKTIRGESSFGDQNFTAKIEVVVSTTTPQVVIESWNNFANF
ncbi:MAG TPA: hypothetical protein PJ997_00290 [Candidatus Paceibacterota bacterium]|nr:hypothetical protein [Candidatus Paceibacterota bacterium]HMP18770.1 hypothetical protein [Candidatus Paceibacterota bacterium]HMP85333.1 hypothetical protein [Candidatus Paceibacterota bacterium]